MENKEKLLELLDKNELTSSEREELDSLLKHPELNEFYNTFFAIKKAVKSGSHLSYEQLYNYILLKNGNEPEDKNFIIQIPQVEGHLRRCNKCTQEFTTLNQEYSDIENFISTRAEDSADKEVPGSFSASRFSAARYAFAGVITLSVLYLLMFFTSEITTPDNYKLAAVDESEFYVTRGRSTDNFQRSLAAIENENYSEAIEYLKSDIQNHKEDESIFYSHYILGLTYLESAEKTFLGLFPSYDKELATMGLRYLKETVALNRSGQFPNITYDAYFFLAKANLMLNYNDAAKHYLSQVIVNKGSKIQEAQQMLRELE